VPISHMPEKQLALMPDPINYGKHKLNIGGADMKAARDVGTTSPLIEYTTNIRGVVGAVDVATIAPTRGYKNVQAKQIRSERPIS
jgi:hypothetical protein